MIVDGKGLTPTALNRESEPLWPERGFFHVFVVPMMKRLFHIFTVPMMKELYFWVISMIIMIAVTITILGLILGFS